MKLLIVAVGKLKDRRLEELVSEYLDRVRKHIPIQVKEVKSPDRIIPAVPRGFEAVALDERGRQLDSAQLAGEIQKRMNRSASGVAFLIGGAEGLGETVRNKADFCLSLSRMTFPHRLTRVILAEQLYRALSIIRSEPYHK